MLELPESSTIARQLNETIQGLTICKVSVNKSPHKFAWFKGDPNNYHRLLGSKCIVKALSYGGLVEIVAGDIRLVFGDGVNLRYFRPGEKLPSKHQLHLEFSDSSSLVCSVQMYGALWAFSEGESEPYYLVAKEKPSPLSEQFDLNYFTSLYNRDDKMSAKAFLATKQRIPGLGNGVLQDILFMAQIHPQRKMDSLSAKEFEAMYQAVRNTLSKMTAKGGRDTEKDLFGHSGGYKTILSNKTKERPCPRCNSKIFREAYMGGKVYFCPVCQKQKQ